jgi:DNA-binding XRE family transcriptional regulator
MTNLEFRILYLKKGFLSQAALARAASIEPQTLCDIRNGRRNTEKHKLRICAILDISYQRLWGSQPKSKGIGIPVARAAD